MFLVVPAQLGSPGRRAVKRLCVSVRVPVYACTHIFPAAIHVQNSVTFSSLHHPYMSCVMCCGRFVVMNFMSSQAAKQAAEDMKIIREDLKISTEEGATFPSKLPLVVFV